MNAEVMIITPALAQEWLHNNTQNRKLSQPHVRKIAQAITNGEWAMNGEAIKFNCDGTLLDGQHRLMAIIDADTPVQSLVITGISTDAQGTMDLGRGRRLVDFLRMDGVSNVVPVASIVSTVGIVESIWAAQAEGRVGNTHDWVSITVGAQRASYHAQDERYNLAAQYGMQLYGALKFPVSAMGTLSYYAQALHPDEWQYFVDSVKTGENLAAGDPALALRSAAMRRGPDGRRSVNRIWAFGIATKAWNAFVRDQQMKYPKFLMNGTHREQLPPVL